MEHRGRQVRTQGWVPGGGPTCVSVQTWSHAKLEKPRGQGKLNAQSEGRGQSTARRVPAPRGRTGRPGRSWLQQAGSGGGEEAGADVSGRAAGLPRARALGTDPVRGAGSGPGCRAPRLACGKEGVHGRRTLSSLCWRTVELGPRGGRGSVTGWCLRS